MGGSWELVLAGAVVGLSVGLTGMGGGALMTPALVMLFGVEPTAAVGSDLVASAAMKPVGALVHHRAGTVRWELVRLLVPASVPAAFAGGFGLHLLGRGPATEYGVRLGVGAALLGGAAALAVRGRLGRRRARTGGADRAGRSGPVVVRPVATLAVGLAGGLLVGLTSAGSGSLVVVMLLLVYPQLDPADLVGTDLVQAGPLVGAAALGHLAAGDVRPALASLLVIGALPGVYLGARLSAKLTGDWLGWLLASVLFASGLMLWQVPAGPAALAGCGLGGAGATSASLSRRADRRAGGRDSGGDGPEWSVCASRPRRTTPSGRRWRWRPPTPTGS